MFKTKKNLANKTSLFLIAILIFCSSILISNAIVSILYGGNVSGETFNVNFFYGSSLIYQAPNYNITFTVSTGNFTAINCNTQFYDTYGFFRGLSQNNTVLSYHTESGIGKLRVKADDGATFISSSTSDGTITIIAGSNFHIYWNYITGDFSASYWMFFIGLLGIFLVIFCPSYSVYKITKEGVDPDTIKVMGYMFALFFIGVGLIIGWLWS